MSPHHSHKPVHTATEAVRQFGLEALLNAAIQQAQEDREIIFMQNLYGVTGDPFEKIRGHFHKANEKMDYLEKQGFTGLDY